MPVPDVPPPPYPGLSQLGSTSAAPPQIAQVQQLVESAALEQRKQLVAAMKACHLASLHHLTSPPPHLTFLHHLTSPLRHTWPELRPLSETTSRPPSPPPAQSQPPLLKVLRASSSNCQLNSLNSKVRLKPCGTQWDNSRPSWPTWRPDLTCNSQSAGRVRRSDG